MCSNIRSGQLSDWITDSCRGSVSIILGGPNPQLADIIEDMQPEIMERYHSTTLAQNQTSSRPNVLSSLIASSARTREERIRPRTARTRDSSRPSSARVRLHPRPDRRQQASILLSSKFHPFSGGPILYLYETKISAYN
ncbi:hypothetical protein YC2023_032669 [Brassica napus]